MTCTLRATPVAGYESSCSTTQVRLIQNEDRIRSSFGMKTVYGLLTHYGYTVQPVLLIRHPKPLFLQKSNFSFVTIELGFSGFMSRALLRLVLVKTC